MKRFQFSNRDLLLIIVIAALAAGWWIDHQRINRLSVQQWEYKSLYGFERTDSDSRLKTLGAEGWEVCGMTPIREGDVNLLLKRPIR